MRIAILGPIGSGKSTFGKHLARYINHTYVPEPIVGISHMEGLLKNFYKDPKTWARVLQLSIALEYEKIHILVSPNAVVDSPYSYMIFGKLHLEDGNITKGGYATLQKIKTDVHYDKLIIIDETPDVIQERVKSRNRKYEVTSLDYIESNAKRYVDTLYHLINRLDIFPTLGADNVHKVTIPDVETPEQYLREVRKIWKSIQSTSKV